MPTALGDTLAAARDVQGRSLKAVAGAAEISTAYLQKLERGEVRKPSPHVLFGLAKALGVEYVDLMELAGYVVPKRRGGDAGTNVLAQALNASGLTDEETDALARYLRFYRDDQRRRR